MTTSPNVLAIYLGSTVPYQCTIVQINKDKYSAVIFYVTPVFMSCYDTLCHDLGSPPGDTWGHLLGTLAVYIMHNVVT